MELHITLPDTKREWQLEALKTIRSSNQNLLLAARRHGKTELLVCYLILRALQIERRHPQPLHALIAPFMNQAKDIAWSRLKYYSSKLTGTKINESEASVTLMNNAKIRLFGGDYPHRIRGNGFDTVCLDEAADIKEQLYKEVLIPALADREGHLVVSGTPRGTDNLLYRLYSEADSNWTTSYFPASRCNVFTDKQLEDIKRKVGDSIYMQEMELDFNATSTDRFINASLFMDALYKDKPLQNNAPIVFGVDCARYGDDYSVVVIRKGEEIVKIDRFSQLDGVQLANEVAVLANRFKPVMIFVDEIGLGAGPLDNLKHMGYKVKGVNAGAKASDRGKFFNLKAELWFKMREWLEYASLTMETTNMNFLRDSLTSPMYSFSQTGQLKIESKDELRKRLGRSPDEAEALMCTFLLNVPSNSLATAMKYNMYVRRPSNYLRK